ncbi:hypothetical protein [Azospirillum palustre]
MIISRLICDISKGITSGDLEMHKRSFQVYIVSAGAMLLSACAGPASTYERSASHFAYPNSNVVPIALAEGKATSTSFLLPDLANPDLEQEAVRNALAESKGDLLVNGVYNWTTTQFPLLPIYNTTLNVKGVSAKMVSGNQVRNDKSTNEFIKNYKK